MPTGNPLNPAGQYYVPGQGMGSYGAGQAPPGAIYMGGSQSAGSMEQSSSGSSGNSGGGSSGGSNAPWVNPDPQAGQTFTSQMPNQTGNPLMNQSSINNPLMAGTNIMGMPQQPEQSFMQKAITTALKPSEYLSNLMGGKNSKYSMTAEEFARTPLGQKFGVGLLAMEAGAAVQTILLSIPTIAQFFTETVTDIGYKTGGSYTGWSGVYGNVGGAVSTVGGGVVRVGSQVAVNPVTSGLMKSAIGKSLAIFGVGAFTYSVINGMLSTENFGGFQYNEMEDKYIWAEGLIRNSKIPEDKKREMIRAVQKERKDALNYNRLGQLCDKFPWCHQYMAQEANRRSAQYYQDVLDEVMRLEEIIAEKKLNEGMSIMSDAELFNKALAEGQAQRNKIEDDRWALREQEIEADTQAENERWAAILAEKERRKEADRIYWADVQKNWLKFKDEQAKSKLSWGLL